MPINVNVTKKIMEKKMRTTVTKKDVGLKKAVDFVHYHIAGTGKRLGKSMRSLLPALLLCLIAPAAIVLAQDKPAAAAQDNPLSAFNKRSYGQIKDWVLRSAEKMPQENYNFKPAESVRSYGQIVGHVA